jgi:hypothetical protein
VWSLLASPTTLSADRSVTVTEIVTAMVLALTWHLLSTWSWSAWRPQVQVTPQASSVRAVAEGTSYLPRDPSFRAAFQLD